MPGLPQTISVSDLSSQFDLLHIYPTLNAMLQAAGSDSPQGVSTYLLSGRIHVKQSNFIRAGGSDTEVLSKLLELTRQRVKRSGVRTNRPETIQVGGHKITFSGKTYTAETDLGIVTSVVTKQEDDCFFSSILPYVSDIYSELYPKRTPQGKEAGATPPRLRSVYDLLPDVVHRTGMISEKDATTFASHFRLYLLIVDERGEAINTRYLDREVPENYRVGTILLYQNHYFTLRSSRSDFLRIAASTMTLPDLTSRKVVGYDVNIKLKAFIDFETVYDTDTVEHSIKTYSGALYLQWGDVTIRKDPNDMQKSSLNRVEEARASLEKSLKARSIEPEVYIEKDCDEQKLLSKCLAKIELEMGRVKDAYRESMHETGKIHQANFNVVFIAYNGARFDFVPIFRSLDEQGYAYDASTPVSASGKLTKFRFFSQFRTVKDLWSLPSSGGWLTRVTTRFSVWDPNCFVTGSLKSVLSSFRVKLDKLDFDHEAAQRAYTRGRESRTDLWIDWLMKMSEQLIEYNARDVTALAELVTILEGIFLTEAGVTDLEYWPTLSGLAYSDLKESKVISLEGMTVDDNTSEGRFSLERVLPASDRVNKAVEIDAEMTFSESLSRVPDEMDLFIRQGIIAGRVSSGAGMMKALGLV